MNLFKRLRNWLRRKREPAPVEIKPKLLPRSLPRKTSVAITEAAAQKSMEIMEEKMREEWLPTPAKPQRRVRRVGRSKKVVHHDISKHMKGKGKHHHSTYRASVKAGIQPEED